MPDLDRITADLTGRAAIITGAASGIGKSIALTLAEAGAAVSLVDINEAWLKETQGQIEEAGGAAAINCVDIADEQAVERCVAAAAERWGRVDILCNNAGIMDDMSLPAATSTDMWNRVLAVNLTGHFFFSRAVLPHMLARKAGSIINTASTSAVRGGGAGIAYTASKHGVAGLTKSIAWSYAPDGIRCNAICPGATATNITGGRGMEMFDQEGLKRFGPVFQLTDRVTSPQSMANLALFLASDASSFINGAIIPVDGGWTAG